VIRRPKQKRFGFLALGISASAALLLGIGFGFGFGFGLAGRDSTGTAAPAPTATIAETADPPIQGGGPPTDDKTTKQRPDPKRAAYSPKPQDFKPSIQILEKQCHDPSGCTISYRLTLSYVGSQRVPAKGVTEVTYLVSGGVGPTTNTLKFTSDQTMPFNSDLIDTPSSSAKLTAKVTKVTYDQFG
jgi:hypothetical protein